jgi:hypothetical protein
MINIKPGLKMSFNTYGSVNGATVFSGTVTGTNLGSAVPVQDEIRANHTTIWQDIPESVRSKYDDNYRTYVYYSILKADGTTVYVGEPWIIEATVSEITEKELNITIAPFDGTILTQEDIRLFFESNGLRVQSMSES